MPKINYQLAATIVTALGLIVVAYLQTQSAEQIAEQARAPIAVESCFERTERLVAERDQERLEKIELIAALAQEINTKKIMVSLLDAMDQEVWVKIRRQRPAGDENVFGAEVDWVMEYANKTYRDSYGVSALAYEGRTDLEAGWSREEAEAFFWNDMKAAQQGKIITQETYRRKMHDPNARLVTKRIIKKLFYFPDGTEALLGTAFDITD